jgi:hypothetical protein
MLTARRLAATSVALVAALASALLLGGGCAQGDLRDLDYTADLTPESLALIRSRPWEFVFRERIDAMPMFYIQFGELRPERDVGFRAEWRAVYLSGFLAQRFYDANFDAEGRNVSFRIVEQWGEGLAWRWDHVKWRDTGGREREYLDATILFGAFGYSRDGESHDAVLLWLPFPLP